MTERIDVIRDALEQNKPSIFIDSPGEFLVKTLAQLLKAESHWVQIYGDAIEPYLRMDFDVRDFPALRIYCEGEHKDFESWFVEGDIKMDSILPPSVITSRQLTQQIQDSLSSAMLQQFRRTPFFNAVSAAVPGLNELGKRFTTDKALGLEVSDDEYAPLTQMTVNFRIDLRQWDLYLTETLRTKDDPFDITLGTLQRIHNVINALNDDKSVNLKVPATGQDIVATT